MTLIKKEKDDKLSSIFYKLMGYSKNKTKRGYEVSYLIGFTDMQTYFWRIYSEKRKSDGTIKLGRKWKNASEKQLYAYFEQIVNKIRPIIRKDGIRSIFLVSPQKKDYNEQFLKHLKKHHQWMFKTKGNEQISFGILYGEAKKEDDLDKLFNTNESKEINNETLENESNFLANLINEIIEKNEENSLYCGIKEIEEIVLSGGKKDRSASEKIDYILACSSFIEKYPQKNRIQRLLQIAKNKGIKTRTLETESRAGSKVDELGGIIGFKTKTKN